MAPIRISNLSILELDRHLVRSEPRGGAMHIVLAGEEVKNHEPLEYPLHSESVGLIEEYIQRFRPLLAPAGCAALFPGRSGHPKVANGFAKQISNTIRHHTGMRINPHLFRHIAAKIYLDANPGGYEVVRRVLGQRSISTTTNFYTGLETGSAVRHFENTILQLRNKSNGQ
jgi:site-specific recombinase XerD